MSHRTSVALALFSATLIVNAQERPAYQSVVERAEQLVDAGHAANAVRDLEAFQCPESDLECAAHIRFATAWAYDDISTRTGEVALARQSIALYQRVLEHHESDAKVLANIARIHARLGEPQEASRMFERAARVEPALASAYLYAAAEAFRQTGQYEGAAGYYHRAGEAGSRDAWSRLVSMHQSRIADARSTEERTPRLEEALSLARTLRGRGENGPALDALQTVLRYGHAGAPELAGVALAEWVEIQALNGTLSKAALELLPKSEQWRSSMLQTLHSSVTSEAWTFGEGWTRGPHRYAAMAAAKAIADQLVASGESGRAVPLYERAMDLGYRNPVPGKPDLFLAAATQLARVYAAQQMPRDLERLEDRLFEIKGDAYRSHDLAAMQRMHAVLGAIYEERDIWSSGYPARNATFQYSQLIRVAKEREEKEGIFQPLPHYAEKAAEGQRREGRLDRARELEIDAARGYLDLDAVDRAVKAIERASDAGGAADPRVAALGQIASYRARISELPTTRGITIPHWSAARGTLDPEFVSRQEFKAISDLAQQARQRDELSEADALYRHALDNALEQKELSGTGDRLRLERIRDSVETQQRTMESPKPETERLEGAAKTREWSIQQSGSRASTVVWPAAVVEGAKDAAKTKVKPPR